MLLFAAHMRFGIGLLAWVAPVPLLRFLRLSSGWRSRLLFTGAMVLTWIACVGKIVTAPVPPFLALLGVGYGLFQAAGYLGADRVRRQRGEAWGVLAFPALMTVLEWAQYRFTPLASWGAAAYTQLDDLALLQTASVLGMAGVSFLVQWFAAAAEATVSARLDGSASSPAERHLVAATLAVVLAHVFGILRLGEPLPGTVKVAAIGTDATFNAGSVLPDHAERSAALGHLLADTERAADAGSKIAVWTEAAALMMPEDEQEFVDRIREVAKRRQIQIVAAYILPVSSAPLRYENKYRWIRSDGTVEQTYFKHHPVPGEPAVVGEEPLVPVEAPFGRGGGAICYDYDYPQLARTHGQMGLDFVVLPSSDWAGIDPIHSQMAALRAIENGTSLIRSTRFGLSLGVDPLGRPRAWQSSFDTTDRVMVFDLPQHGIRTIYSRIGEVLIDASIVFLLLAFLPTGLRRGYTSAASSTH